MASHSLSRLVEGAVDMETQRAVEEFAIATCSWQEAGQVKQRRHLQPGAVASMELRMELGRGTAEGSW